MTLEEFKRDVELYLYLKEATDKLKEKIDLTKKQFEEFENPILNEK